VARERNFTRDASHELRSPLTVIKVAADVMLADSALEPFEERSLNRIKRATRDMEALMEAFLILAREDDVGLPDEDFVANEAVALELERANDLVKGKPVQLRQVVEAQFALHAPPRVFGVMVGNLLRNACIYTEQGSVTVTIGRDFVRVEDTGPGISPDEMRQLFKPYYRGRQTGSGGHGIGLTIVKRLSDRFRWPLELESRVGVGTSATIRLPQPTAGLTPCAPPSSCSRSTAAPAPCRGPSSRPSARPRCAPTSFARCRPGTRCWRGAARHWTRSRPRSSCSRIRRTSTPARARCSTRTAGTSWTPRSWTAPRSRPGPSPACTASGTRSAWPAP
jgi:hypothetical protein